MKSENEDTMDLELKVEKTEIPKNLKIIKEMRDKDIRYILNRPVRLPYDKNIKSKIAKGTDLSVAYFTDVLKSFCEDISPDIFPKGFYNEMKIDDNNLYRIEINPEDNDIFQYSFNLDFLRKDPINIPHISKSYETMDITTSIFIQSEIFNP